MLTLKPILTCILLAGIAISAFGQSAKDSSDNVAIQKNFLTVKFVKGSGANPVLVTTEETSTYTCRKYRKDIPVAEFYNDNQAIDAVDIQVDGKSRSSSMVKCEYYNQDGIFFSDEHICYFELPITKIGGRSEVTFKKTTNDPRYFTSVYFSSLYPIDQQEVRIYVPDWMKVEFKEFNTEKYGVKQTKTREGDQTVYIYRASNIPGFKKESRSPGMSYLAPHLLVMCKQASPGGVAINYFNTLQDQYNWYAGLVKQVDNDKAFIKTKTEEIIKGATTDEEKVKRIFLWVQDNVRYIAFEDGIAGFKPEKAQEVLRKKYGDCKGMANLLTVMLQSINLDARRCWIGTRDIAYDYSTPALSVDNHMICAWMKQGKPVFLDATEKYIGYGEVAERIQGRQTLIENGDKYLLTTVPVSMPTQNTALENRKFAVDGNNLKGHVVQVWKGESKEWLLTQLNDMKQDKRENALKEYLTGGNADFQISNMKVTNLTDYNNDLKVEYDVLWKNALSTFDKDSYLSLDNRESLKGADIDTTDRKFPLWHYYKLHIVQETELDIPGKKLTEVPEKLVIKHPKYSFQANYSQQGTKVLYRNEISFTKTDILPSEFSQWNSDVKKLSDFYNQQIVLKAQ
ncbi:MAG: transglutaminase domain-containing protein [Chitinophagaceae bacterium]